MNSISLLAALVGISSIGISSISISSVSAFAHVSHTGTNCAKNGEFELSLVGDDLEIRVLASFVAISLPKSRGNEFVTKSEKVARGEAVPYCETVLEVREHTTSEYTACYFAKEVEPLLFGNFASVSIPTSCLITTLSTNHAFR